MHDFRLRRQSHSVLKLLVEYLRSHQFLGSIILRSTVTAVYVFASDVCYLVMDSGEGSRLLRRYGSPNTTSIWAERSSGHKCVSSKAALLCLIWSFSLGLLNAIIFQLGNFIAGMESVSSIFLACAYAFNAIILCFYPLAGFLADIKCGRFKAIMRSSQLLLLSLIIGIIFSIILLTCSFTVQGNVELYAVYIFLLMSLDLYSSF